MLTDQSLRYYRDSVAEEVSVFSHRCSTHRSAPLGVPGAPKLTPGRLSSQMPRSWSTALQGFVLLKDLLRASLRAHCTLGLQSITAYFTSSLFRQLTWMEKLIYPRAMMLLSTRFSETTASRSM